MSNLLSASSADLHLRIKAFGVLFTVLAVSFGPAVGFCLALVATIVLSKV